jgi:hypothetical protein
MKYIYLIKSVEDSYYKIGISKHPNKRLSQLQTGNSAHLKLIGTYQSEYANQIEGTLQRRYSHLHKEGEWFDMPIDIELSFLNECKKIEETLSSLKRSGNIFI